MSLRSKIEKNRKSEMQLEMQVKMMTKFNKQDGWLQTRWTPRSWREKCGIFTKNFRSKNGREISA